MPKQKFTLFLTMFPLLVVGSLALYYYGIFGSLESDEVNTQFSDAFNESLLQINSASDCLASEVQTEDIASCFNEKIELAKSSVQPFTHTEGCVGEIANKIVEITETMDKAADMLFTDVSSEGLEAENSNDELVSLFSDINKKVDEIYSISCS